MQELAKRISGDWVDISKSALQIRDLVSYFALGVDELKEQISGLKYAVESGVTEYKGALLIPLFTSLEEMKFKSLSFDELREKNKDPGILIFLTMIQRLFASGSLNMSFIRDVNNTDLKQNDINMIIADVLTKIRENPQYKNNPAVKMILTQVFIYKRERETMNKLSPNIKDKKKAEAFYRNFNITFRKIFDSIQKNYTELLNEEKKENLKNIDKNILANIPLKRLVPLFTKQSREFSQVRSTLAYALEDKYKTREILVNLAKQKENFLKLIEQENSLYNELCKGLKVANPKDYAQNLSISFAMELAKVLEKLLLKWEEPPAE